MPRKRVNFKGTPKHVTKVEIDFSPLKDQKVSFKTIKKVPKKVKVDFYLKGNRKVEE